MASFSKNLRRIREERKMTQQQLADMLNVNRSTITHWESGKRMPDITMLRYIANCLDVEIGVLMGTEPDLEKVPVVIMVDDEKLILSGNMSVVKAAMPHADVKGFTRPSDAIAYAGEHHVALAFLDIEMGRMSGLDLCKELLSIDPRTNVVFLTAYMDYSFQAWETCASGFLLKPLTVEAVESQLGMLRHPIWGI